MTTAQRIFLMSVFSITGLIAHVPTAAASRVDELRDQIRNRNAEIEQLEKEIAAHQTELNKVQGEATTLNNAVRSLDLSIKKFDTDIRLTETRIKGTSAEIDELGEDIEDTRGRIEVQSGALAGALRSLRERESHSLAIAVLSGSNLSGFFDEMESLSRFQQAVQSDLTILRDLKERFIAARVSSEEKRQSLQKYTIELADKKNIVEYNKVEKKSLLTLTKNKEANYKALVENAQERKEAFEREMQELESQLRIEIDPKSMPGPQPGILAWPLKEVTITQTFGNTAFARANSHVYRGSGHNGIDFRAQTGTPIYAALSGTVAAAGNTDAVPGCYSYGKWVLVRHNNGLSTLYAHLSVIKVEASQQVATGDILGYSGKTGYATGPHLHFTLYATQGVRVQKFDGSIGCKSASIPIADQRAYLNPLSYLPAL